MRVDIPSLSKAELHVHLEGSISPETLARLSPGLTAAEARARYAYKDFAGFIQAFRWVVELLETPEDYAAAARDLFIALAAQNVRYAEVTFSAGVVIWKRHDLEASFAALHLAAMEAPIEVRWVLDCVRQHGPVPAMEVARFAALHRQEGIVAFGIGGDEKSIAATLFEPSIRLAIDGGLHFAPHAGETSNAGNIWEMVRLGAHRIGHGIRAVQDPALIAHLRDNDIPLEISITSNIATGAIPILHKHPLRALWDAGVPIVLNTDDPAMFHTTLNREYEIAAAQFGFNGEELTRLARNGFRYAFDCYDAERALETAG